MSTDNATPAPKTRQELYDQIRESSLDEVILAKMIRYGYWPENGTIPEDPADDIRRMGDLERELGRLRTELARTHDVERLAREARKQRMKESKERQKENKARRIREREERAAAWKERKKRDILYLGEGVSGTLHDYNDDLKRLEEHGLPGFENPADLASEMGISVPELRFLSFNRRVSPIHHYKRFEIPKKTGGTRAISAPMPRLKAAQHWVLHNILGKVALHEAAHGFRPLHSIVSNAQPHVGADVVVNIDLKDFFPTITYNRVWGCFRALGYSKTNATFLALLTTEAKVTEVEMDGQTYFIARGERHLPQGGPTSPALTNIICRRLDKRLTDKAGHLGFTYTRYADDMTFSASGEANVGKLLAHVRSIVAQEGFRIHPDKTRVFRKGRRQEVTGLIVNEKVGVDRRLLKRFRATLFQIEKDGPDGKHWNRSQAHNLFDTLQGFANFVSMVDAEKGAALVSRVKTLRAKHKA